MPEENRLSLELSRRLCENIFGRMKKALTFSGSLLKEGEEFINGHQMIDRAYKLRQPTISLEEAKEWVKSKDVPEEVKRQLWPYHMVIADEQSVRKSQNTILIWTMFWSGRDWHFVQQRIRNDDGEQPLIYSNATRVLVEQV